MRTAAFSLLCTALLFAGVAIAQPVLRVVVPVNAVVAGEAFQVQYVLEGTSEPVSSFQSPAFSGLRLVSGPVVYQGKSGGMLRNYVYTLEASGAGTVMIPPFTVTVAGQTLRSREAFLRVITKDEADRQPAASEYVLARGEDPQQKIRRNLFLKLEVDRRQVYPGEPVTAVFKLYSRLQSRSDIVKNPGFYGFTVYDMINLDDHLVTTETVNGLPFDVHVIRKVQLFPLRPGAFTIDEMEVNNRVEFSRSGTSRKTEQEVAEGLRNDEEVKPANPDALLFENTMKSAPVTITVRPYPGQAAPEGFAGAAGHFRLSASLGKGKLMKKEEGVLEIVIHGKGNFTQLVAPVVIWPQGIEAFDPETIDEIDRHSTPLAGKRIFRYRFTAQRSGTYRLEMPPFVFFDTDSNRFSRSGLSPLNLEVSQEERPADGLPEMKTSLAAINRRVSLLAAGLVILAVVTVLVYWATRRKKPVVNEVTEASAAPSVEDLFAPAEMAAEAGEGFYAALYQCNWNYYASRLGLPGSGMNKQLLFTALKERNADPGLISSLDSLLSLCEWHTYTATGEEGDELSLLEESRRLARALAG